MPVSDEIIDRNCLGADGRWCDCHLNNGMVCPSYFYLHYSGDNGHCASCGHEESCHEHERFTAAQPAEGWGSEESKS